MKWKALTFFSYPEFPSPMAAHSTGLKPAIVSGLALRLFFEPDPVRELPQTIVDLLLSAVWTLILQEKQWHNTVYILKLKEVHGKKQWKIGKGQ